MLCGRWHRSDALPRGPMALLKITVPRLAAVCVFPCLVCLYMCSVCTVRKLVCVCVCAVPMHVDGPALVCVLCVYEFSGLYVCVPSGQLACQSLLSCLSHFSHSGELKRRVEAFHGWHAADCTDIHTDRYTFLLFFCTLSSDSHAGKASGHFASDTPAVSYSSNDTDIKVYFVCCDAHNQTSCKHTATLSTTLICSETEQTRN